MLILLLLMYEYIPSPYLVLELYDGRDVVIYLYTSWRTHVQPNQRN